MSEPEAPFRAGFAALLGKPNAGKSTLLNRIVGMKLAAVSALPQTTRDKFAGVHTDEQRQIVFLDLPGYVAPTDRLNECLRANVLEGIGEVDVVVHLIDVEDPDPVPQELVAVLQKANVPLVLALNKLDGKRARTDAGSWAGEALSPAVRSLYSTIVGVSAHTGTGIPELLDAIGARLQVGPLLFDPEQTTDRDMRYLAQEMIREKAFLFLHEELPYSTAVLVDEFKEREEGKWYIRATIYVERDSQKGMVIGKGGASLKKISTAARADIEKITGTPVFLELWVKVREKWRRNDADLRMFGLKPPRQPKPRRK